MGSPGGRAADRPRRIAIVGAGPSGIYAAEALTRQTEVPVAVDLIDRLELAQGGLDSGPLGVGGGGC